MAEPQLIRLRLPAKFPNGRRIERRPDGSVITSWWKDGKLHRDPKEGPAWHRKHAKGERSEWIVGGKLHRDATDGPAVIDTDFDGKGITCEEYYKDGQWHRPWQEGPAITNTDPSGRRLVEIYVELGMPHRDPDCGPAWHQTEDGVERWEYRMCGMKHRDAGQGPAVIRRDERTGTVIAEEHWHKGELHRDKAEGPAVIRRSETTGAVIGEEFYQHGKCHRDGAPAVIIRNDQGVTTIHSWYKNGVLHRDPNEGPAETRWDDDGTISRNSYWVEGVPIFPVPEGAATDA